MANLSPSNYSKVLMPSVLFIHMNGIITVQFETNLSQLQVQSFRIPVPRRDLSFSLKSLQVKTSNHNGNDDIRPTIDLPYPLQSKSSPKLPAWVERVRDSIGLKISFRSNAEDCNVNGHLVSVDIDENRYYVTLVLEEDENEGYDDQQISIYHFEFNNPPVGLKISRQTKKLSIDDNGIDEDSHVMVDVILDACPDITNITGKGKFLGVLKVLYSIRSIHNSPFEIGYDLYVDGPADQSTISLKSVKTKKFGSKIHKHSFDNGYIRKAKLKTTARIPNPLEMGLENVTVFLESAPQDFLKTIYENRYENCENRHGRKLSSEGSETITNEDLNDDDDFDSFENSKEKKQKLKMAIEEMNVASKFNQVCFLGHTMCLNKVIKIPVLLTLEQGSHVQVPIESEIDELDVAVMPYIDSQLERHYATIDVLLLTDHPIQLRTGQIRINFSGDGDPLQGVGQVENHHITAVHRIQLKSASSIWFDEYHFNRMAHDSTFASKNNEHDDFERGLRFCGVNTNEVICKYNMIERMVYNIEYISGHQIIGGGPLSLSWKYIGIEFASSKNTVDISAKKYDSWEQATHALMTKDLKAGCKLEVEDCNRGYAKMAYIPLNPTEKSTVVVNRKFIREVSYNLDEITLEDIIALRDGFGIDNKSISPLLLLVQARDNIINLNAEIGTLMKMKTRTRNFSLLPSDGEEMDRYSHEDRLSGKIKNRRQGLKTIQKEIESSTCDLIAAQNKERTQKRGLENLIIYSTDKLSCPSKTS